MEMRGEDEEIRTPSPLCYNPSNRESSTKLPNPDHQLLTAADRSRRDHTVPQLNFSHQQNNQNNHKLSLHQYIHKNTRDNHPEATPDPVQTSLTASPSAVSQPIASRSISRTPLTTATDSNNIIPSSVRYRECLKNHAASTGGHVLDGCGEFMPGGEDGTPEALKCAACECHRNFHRKEMKNPEHSQQALPPSGFFISNSVRTNGHRTDRTPVPLSRHHQLPAVPISSMMMAFGGSNGAPDESSSEDLNMYHQSNNGARDLYGQQQQLMKKRFRTKFTQGQKDKMVEFAEKLGWKIQKHDELEVQQFCADVGVRRQVFKVWMHNNKQAMKKKEM